MELNKDDIVWWRADARDAAAAITRAVHSITRADLVFAGYALLLFGVKLFVWPAAPILGPIYLPLAIRRFIWPDRSVRRWKQRIAEGDDRYFEEQRFLRVNSIGTATQVRRRAALMIASCVVTAILEVCIYYA